MLQKKSTEIRRISKENYIENDKQSEAALRNYLKTRENEIKNDVFSFNAETYDEDRFKDLAKDEFRINGKYFDEELKDLSENKFKDQFRKDVLAKHKKHVGKVHGIFAKNIELATRPIRNSALSSVLLRPARPAFSSSEAPRINSLKTTRHCLSIV